MSTHRSSLLRILILFIGLIIFYSQPAGYARADGPEPISQLSDVHKAVVRIVAVGTFREPEGVYFNQAGSGSGFIIDPSGIAVTNNHVVTGAGILKVYVAGEEEPRSARVLGVSECSDLAVIDIAGEGYPYLEWYEGDVQVGLDVYTAGFPLRTTEFTMTRGIVSQAKASGETDWASVGEVLMHDATINPGNSGGPLVNTEAKVIGVNYSGNNFNQYFAIARDEALPVIEQLRTGVDDLSLGINGRAFINEDGNGLGIWVSSVKSGSPADRVGVEPGDLIYGLEGLPLGEQGTMTEYCDILRSHHPEEVMSVEVARFDTGELLTGRLNDDQGQLEVSGNLPAPEDEPGLEYSTTFNDNGLLQVEIPTTWTEINSTLPAGEERFAAILMASPDLETFLNNWTVPGLIFAVSTESGLTIEGLLDGFDYSDSCTHQGRESYEDALYAGLADVWLECGGEGGSSVVVLSVKPADESYTALVLVQMVDEADDKALERILNTFIVSEEITSQSSTPDTPAGLDGLAGLTEDTIEYTAIADENNLLQVEIPTTWTEINSTLPAGEERFAAILMASPDLETFLNNWTVPGLIFAVSTESGLTIEGLLDGFDYSDSCTHQGRESYEDALYAGLADVWLECGGEGGSSVVVLSVKPADESYTALVLVQMVDEADDKVLERILNTFIVSSSPGESAESGVPDKPRIIGLAKAAIEYTAIADENNLLQVEIPTTWTEINSTLPAGEERFAAILMASPDLETFLDNWTVPGLIFAVSTESGLTVEGLLDGFDYSDSCTHQGRESYEDALHAGLVDIWLKCGGEGGSGLMVLSVKPADESYTALVLVQVVEEVDVEVLEHILNTYAVSSLSSSPPEGEEVAAEESAGSDTPAVDTGLGYLSLWGSSTQGSIAPGGERWYLFNSNGETEATLIAFLRNAGQVDMLIYHEREIPVWPHHDPNSIPNLGMGSEQGNRDQDGQTRELVWQGPVEKDHKYYVRLINRGNTQAQYCIAPRPDKYTCPY